MFKIAFLLVATALSIVSAKTGTGIQYIETDTFDNGIDLWQNCDTYTDCFNCTLSKCDWKTKVKGATPTCNNFPNKTTPNDAITIPEFLIQSHQCGDPLGICGFKHDNKTKEVELTFTSKSAFVPPNYFCTYNLQDHGNSFERYVMKTHQLEMKKDNKKTEYESNVFVFSKHLHSHGEGEKPTFTYDQFPDEYIHEQIQDGPIPGSFLIEHSSKATIGWINIKGRAASVAKEFSITIKQLSKSDLNDEYWHQNECWIITIMVIVCLIMIFLIWYHFIHKKNPSANSGSQGANSGASANAGGQSADTGANDNSKGQDDDQQALLQNQM